MSGRIAALLVAAVLGALILYGVGAFSPAVARAQTAPTYTVPDKVPQEWVDTYNKVRNGTKSSNPVIRDTSRRIMTRANGRVLGSKLVGGAARLGPAGLVAGGIGVGLYYELKYFHSIHGEQSIPTKMNITAAPGSKTVYGVNPDNTSGRMTFLKELKWKVYQNSDGRIVSDSSMVSDTYVSTWYKVGCATTTSRWDSYGGSGGIFNGQGMGSGASLHGQCYASGEGPPADYVANELTSSTGLVLDPANKDYAHYLDTYAAPWASPAKTATGPKLCEAVGCEFTKRFPTVVVGGVDDGTAPSGSASISATPSQGNDVIASVVLDPETPTVAPEADPNSEPLYPPDWEDYPPPPPDPDYPAPTTEPPDQDDPYVPPAPTEPGYNPTLPGSDPDQDGQPNEADEDDDGDGIPDADDPNPTTPTDPATLPQDHPYADPDKDGIPNKDDADDDNDGIPDKDDPNPTTPTDPATLPVDNPYADPDGDGIPNKDDGDDDNDGTPDEADIAPTDPNKGGDLDRDGIPDQNDGDQDQDGVPDWEDIEPRNPAVPNKTPDLDGDGVPDWSDPWPGNPHAPADPTIDKDLDGVPDYKDPVINEPLVPMKPWAPGSPGDVPTNPGQPNIPQGPPNTNYPTSPTMPANPGDSTTWPSDPTSPISPTTPISPHQPMPPGQPGGPPGDGATEAPPPPPPDTGTSCPIPRKPVVSVPKIAVADVFPFSLVIYAIQILGQLHGDPEAPTWEIPYLGPMDLDAEGGMLAATKIPITGFIIVALLIAWYMLIKGSEA